MYWKLALVQHPMYILIKEDTVCAERTPPWGAPDIESYIERLRRNLGALRKFPQLRIGYEWSGLELEQLAQDAPDVFADMLDLVKSGQTTFYNGTYAQPHLQTLSSEANYRQFEWGARVYRELCGDHQVLVYAHQEASVNDQTPQLLKAFGIPYGAIPHFISTLVMGEGAEITYHVRNGATFIHGSEFASWQGLDGTLLDLYLQDPSRRPVKDWLAYQEMLGYLHVPPVVAEIPDLIEVDEQWIAERSAADFALLDDVLPERLQAFPPRFKVRLFTNWSYIEGIRAEELSRNNWQAEVSALRAEALNSLAYALLKRAPESTDPIWKTILTTQHHDVYCFCAPELRDKSVRWLQESQAQGAALAERAAQAIAEQIDTRAAAGQPLVVFNTVPHAQQSVITTTVDVDAPKVTDLAGNTLPCEATPLPSGQSRLRFAAGMPGLGYATLQVQAGGERPHEETIAGCFTFENEFYRAVVGADGAFTSLVVRPSGDELLAGAANPGNVLAARDSTGLGPQHEGTFPEIWGEKWEPSARGAELCWQPTGPAQVRHSALGSTLTIPGAMCPQVSATLVVSFYRSLARIDLDWAFSFDQASIGHFFDDDTKLRVQWPLAFQGDVHHDISFGVVQARDERPILPASWLDISDGKKGLAYLHQGTLKHWITGQTLFNLFAWGEHTDAIGNRISMVRWPKCFDQRLDGTHVIHTALYPHAGDWRQADVMGAARSYGMPAMALATDRHPGKLPSELQVCALTDPELAATTIQVEGSQLVCRLYSVAQQPVRIRTQLRGLTQAKVVSLMGETLETVAPYQIGHMFLQPGEE